jgi:ABC-type tungstate transport system permease subunit
VKAIVAGSGDVLKQGARGEGDVLLTHSPEAEKAWMVEGNGTSRRLVMYNDFVNQWIPTFWDLAQAKAFGYRNTENHLFSRRHSPI